MISSTVCLLNERVARFKKLSSSSSLFHRQCSVSTTMAVSDTLRSRHWLHKLRVVMRGCFLVLVWTPAALLSPIAYLIPSFRGVYGWILQQTFALSGPVAVKMAQWASSRPDLVARELAEALQMLQDRVPVGENRATIARAVFGEATKERKGGKKFNFFIFFFF